MTLTRNFISMTVVIRSTILEDHCGLEYYRSLDMMLNFLNRKKKVQKIIIRERYLVGLAKDYLQVNKAKAEELYKNNPDPYNPSCKYYSGNI
jgi:hypothetical protein